MKHILKKILILVLTLMSLSCAHLNKQDDLNDIRFQLDQHPILKNGALDLYLKNLIGKIGQLQGSKSIQVVVADTNDIQAMSYYDTRIIYISRGMLYAIKNEAELVALLSHELGHFQLKHGLADVQNQNEAEVISQISNIFEDAAGISISDETKKYLEKIRHAQFSQNIEVEADDFAIQSTSHLGYSAVAYANLFDRISKLDTQNVLQKLSAVVGTHPALAARAQHVRDYIIQNKIASSQKAESASYLKAVSGIVPTTKNAIDESEVKSRRNAEFQIEILNQKITNLHKKKISLSVVDFLKYMTALRSAAIDLEILDQIQTQLSSSETDKLNDVAPHDANEFMMELIRLDKPLWVS
ncbi:MAG: M48 family metalloprotease, partial [Bdellovibrionales bacterium]